MHLAGSSKIVLQIVFPFAFTSTFAFTVRSQNTRCARSDSHNFIYLTYTVKLPLNHYPQQACIGIVAQHHNTQNQSMSLFELHILKNIIFYLIWKKKELFRHLLLRHLLSQTVYVINFINVVV